jgi:hypothetical protein
MRSVGDNQNHRGKRFRRPWHIHNGHGRAEKNNAAKITIDFDGDPDVTVHGRLAAAGNSVTKIWPCAPLSESNLFPQWRF